MDPSSHDMSDLHEIIFSRIRAAVGHLADAKERLHEEGIKGDTQNIAKELLCGIVDIVEGAIEQRLDEIRVIKEEDAKIKRSSILHGIVQDYLYLIDVIRRGSLQIPSELGHLVRIALKDLHASDVSVLVLPGPSLSTISLPQLTKDLLASFGEARVYMQSRPSACWILFVPPTISRTPVNWPVIIHELGHVLEKQEWQLVKQFYPYPVLASPITPHYPDSDVRSYYAQEFQADFIALSYCGPVFARRLLAMYYSREMVISRTHPPWAERLAALAERLEKAGLEDEAGPLRKVREKVPPLIGRDRIDRLPELMANTEAKLDEIGCTYKPNPTEEEKASGRLKQMAPYTEDVRVLMNAADHVLGELRDTISEPDGAESKRRLESNFDYLLRDCIRLTHTRRLVEPAMQSPSP